MFKGFKLQKVHIIVLAIIVALILLLYISSRKGLEVNLAADQTSGEAPLPVNFTVTTTATPETITEYRWDFDGDGNIDETTPTNTVSHIYSQDGTFNVNVKIIVDNKEYSSQNAIQINVEQPIAIETPPSIEEGPPLEAKQHLQQGMTYVSLAQKNPMTSSENYENALLEFSNAVDLYPNYAEAYSNRGVVYMQQKKFNKALEDLKRSAELKPEDPIIYYNLAALYSLQNQLDLALDALDKALEYGFNNYDALKPSGRNSDPDLNNLRRHPEYRKVLETHKVFIFK